MLIKDGLRHYTNIRRLSSARSSAARGNRLRYPDDGITYAVARERDVNSGGWGMCRLMLALLATSQAYKPRFNFLPCAIMCSDRTLPLLHQEKFAFALGLARSLKRP
jgi:hypothetical protein